MLQVAEDSVATLPQQQVADDGTLARSSPASLYDLFWSIIPATRCSISWFEFGRKESLQLWPIKVVGQFCAEERSLIILIKTGRGVVHSLHCLGSICAERREAAQY